MDKELHGLLKYLEKLLIKSDGAYTNINIAAIRKSIEYLRIYETIISKKDKDSSHHQNNRKKLRDLYNTRYQQKAIEISGRGVNDDGKPIYPRWDAKVNSLLKMDYTENGYNSLVRYIELFFADDVESVADFTRKVNKAGYSYTIFHTMIPKLAMYGKKPRIPCIHCGRRDGHAPGCPEFKKAIEKEHKFETEIIEHRKNLEGISIEDMFKSTISNRGNLNGSN